MITFEFEIKKRTVFLIICLIVISVSAYAANDVFHADDEIISVSASKILPGNFGDNFPNAVYYFPSKLTASNLFFNKLVGENISLNSSGTLNIYFDGGNLTVDGNSSVSKVINGSGGGLYGLRFPAPDYDSGWINLTKGGYVTKNHSLGGNVDDYFINLDGDYYAFIKQSNFNLGKVGIFSDYYQDAWDCNWISKLNWSRGYQLYNLTNQYYSVYANSGTNNGQFRMRIWKFN